MPDSNSEPKQRIIQEYVPGKQVTLAHVIANPQKSLFAKLGLDESTGDAIGIMTITPSEGVIIAADIATKDVAVEIGVLDRFGSSLPITGTVSSLHAAPQRAIASFGDLLPHAPDDMTHS